MARDFAELDDLLAEWHNMCRPSRSNVTGAVACIELVAPQAKGKLPWIHAILSGWSVVHTPKHTVPMMEGPAV